MLFALNLNYPLPSRKTSSTAILDICYFKFRQFVKNNYSKDAVLLLDSLKNDVADAQNVVAMLRLDNLKHTLEAWHITE